MQTEKYRKLAIDIAELYADGYLTGEGKIEPYEPAEFQAGLELCMAMYMVAVHPNDLDEVLKLHQVSQTYFVEEVESRSHQDDKLDLFGITL